LRTKKNTRLKFNRLNQSRKGNAFPAAINSTQNLNIFGFVDTVGNIRDMIFLYEEEAEEF
jgi:hypothetical protein